LPLSPIDAGFHGEVDSVVAPVQRRAKAVLVKVCSVGEATLNGTVIRANSSRLTSLAIPDLRLVVRPWTAVRAVCR